MPAERREWAIVFEIGSTGNGRNPVINGRRQPSRGGTSRMNREVQVRICERLGVKFPGRYVRSGRKLTQPLTRIAGCVFIHAVPPVGGVPFHCLRSR